MAVIGHGLLYHLLIRNGLAERLHLGTTAFAAHAGDEVVEVLWLHHRCVHFEAVLTLLAVSVAIREVVTLRGLLELRGVLEVIPLLLGLQELKLLDVEADLVDAAFVRRVFGVDALHALVVLDKCRLLPGLSIALPFVTYSLAFVHVEN